MTHSFRALSDNRWNRGVSCCDEPEALEAAELTGDQLAARIERATGQRNDLKPRCCLPTCYQARRCWTSLTGQSSRSAVRFERARGSAHS